MQYMKLLLLTSFLSAFVLSVSAQIERVSEVDYNIVLAKALDTASSHDRRVSTEEFYYAGEQMNGTRRIVSDFVGPDAKIDVVEDFKGKKRRSNSITLNGQFFCKDGEKAWKRADKDCAKAGRMIAIPDGDYEYFVEPDPKIAGRKIYTRRASYKASGSPERDAVRLKFIEIKFVTDETGLILEYSETRRGGIEPNGWSSTQVTRYDYEPADMRITDPTRNN
jgi:hypothetical protein